MLWINIDLGLLGMVEYFMVLKPAFVTFSANRVSLLGCTVVLAEDGLRRHHAQEKKGTLATAGAKTVAMAVTRLFFLLLCSIRNI